ncbi:putative px domain protein [Phaeomoniella chlamydospora]|uniref:Putative px domain protein n=1 Tax=Phaeomoniella chlamydospora TaxID=158046 RepID=A0A0G2DT13_PHACM|nr:putative px domain protein [Phaeomoniella chlamydospora]
MAETVSPAPTPAADEAVSVHSTPPEGQILTGKQEHYLKRELISRQVHSEIAELNSPTALQRFGAPFKSDYGEVAPVDSELPILRYIFVNHVRNFPFLDKAREKEFWQDKLQAFLESFAKKNISSSEDRLEETKRRKLAQKCEKLVELMMVSGIPTASGYEERIRFAELEVVDRGANEQGLLVNMPEGNMINGWAINVAGVRTTSVKRTNPQIAQSKAMADFLTLQPIQLNEEEMIDIERRKEMDEKRIEEQRQFYEIARKRAQELDVYMEKFRRDIVESNGLSKLFQEIRTKEKIADLSTEYQKFAEWLRIEVAATIYHLFLAEDNSPELFAQAKRIHSLVPYTLMKNVIRIANPAAVMSGVLDLFLAQPFGSRSLLQRIFSMTLNDGIRSFQKSIDALSGKIDDPVLVGKLKAFVNADEDIKNEIRAEAASESVDLVVTILRSDQFPPELTAPQIGKIYNAYVAWNSAIDNVDDELKQGAQFFASLKQMLKLLTRQRDKAMMLNMIEEPTTLYLFRDLFTIFYEPLIRVYKSANVYNSITDFSVFADDAIRTVEQAQRQDIAADPNQTVQSFIDLCARHEDNFYKFVHEVHIHDNGLFGSLMSWIEDILQFLRLGPKGGKLDMNALFRGALDMSQIDKDKAISEINALVKWQEARKKWHQDKTRQKMAAEGTGGPQELVPGSATFKSSDFGINEMDLQELAMDDEESSDEDSEDDDLDPIAAERKRRAKKQDHLRRTAGEPQKPEVTEILTLHPAFLAMLRMVLAE